VHKGRFEAFTDAVIAIILTIMVLDLRPPHVPTWAALDEIRSEFLAYILSFIFLGIYWNNHHHMMQSAQKVNGAVLWANLHLLFWLSLVPFSTAFMGDTGFARLPVLLYGVVLLMSGTAYYILTRTLIGANGAHSAYAKALGSDFKGKISVVVYLVGIAIAGFLPWLGYMVYAVVSLIWLIPDRRFERPEPNP
jgi:uncharacterized membrane protein